MAHAQGARGGWGRAGRLAGIYAGALACGFVGDWLNLPLPWMIGAMVFATALRLADLAVPVLPLSRALGQIVVAAAVGLSFTPEAVAALGALIVPMLAAALLTVVAGFASAAVLMRLGRTDMVTAGLASVPIGPVESANLARRHGVAPGPVVLAQTLRIMLLIVVIPPVLVALDGSVRDPSAALRAMPWTAEGAALLFAAALGGGFLAWWLRISNPFFVGSLAGAAGAAALTLPVTAFPYPVLVGAQLFLGVWLGAVFDRALIARARGFVPAALVSTLVMVSLCAAMGLALAWLTGLPWEVMVLATAPGSVTEMALTAKILQEGIAVVTAFHLVRIFLILPAAPLIFRIAAHLAGRHGLGPGGRNRPPD